MPYIAISQTSDMLSDSVTFHATGSLNHKEAARVFRASDSQSMNVIGAKAFYGCKKLKKITINSKVLTKAGTKAFAGTSKNIRIKVPTKKVAAYKKLLKKKELTVLSA